MTHANTRWWTYLTAAALLLGTGTIAQAKKARPAADAPAAADDDKDKNAADDVETGKTRAKEVSGKALDKSATEAKVGKLNQQVSDLDNALKASDKNAAPPASASSSRKARLAAEAEAKAKADAAAAAGGGKKAKDVDPKASDPKSDPKDAKPAADASATMTRKQRLAAEAAAKEAAAKAAAADAGK